MQKLKILAYTFIFLASNKSVNSMQTPSPHFYEYLTESTNLSISYLQKYSAFIKSSTQKSTEYAQEFLNRTIPLVKRSQEFCLTHQQLIGKTSLIICGLYASYAIIRNAKILGMINYVQKKIAIQLLHAGYMSTCDWALAHGADINQAYEDGKTALHIAADQGDIKRMHYLIMHSANLHTFDRLNPALYPIHYAARKGNIAAIELLINAGDNINMALWAASANGQLETVKWTIQHGANPRMQTLDGHTALTIANENGHTDIEKYLLSLQPAIQNSTSIENNLCAHFTQLLHNAIVEQNVDRASFAIRSYASLVDSNESQSPLRLTIAPSEGQCQTPLDEIAKILVNAGVPINNGDTNGNTPLHIAAINGNRRLATLFLQYGANANLQNNYYSTALDIALEKGDIDMQMLLERFTSPILIRSAAICKAVFPSLCLEILKV